MGKTSPVPTVPVTNPGSKISECSVPQGSVFVKVVLTFTGPFGL